VSVEVSERRKDGLRDSGLPLNAARYPFFLARGTLPYTLDPFSGQFLPAGQQSLQGRQVCEDSQDDEHPLEGAVLAAS